MVKFPILFTIFRHSLSCGRRRGFFGRSKYSRKDLTRQSCDWACDMERFTGQSSRNELHASAIHAHFALEVLGLRHLALDTRDVALFLPLRRALNNGNSILPLPLLVSSFMQRSIRGRHQEPVGPPAGT